MYGTSASYGWSNGPRQGQVVELPMRPVRRRSGYPMCFEGCCVGGFSWLSFGIILSLLAAASLALGVADVVLTYQTYMNDQNCKNDQSTSICMTNNLVWTWVASGIWGSLPTFIFGILAIRLGKRSSPMGSSWFELFGFLSAFIFAPAMIVLSALEVWKGSGVYYWTYTSPLTKDDLAKAIIPIVIAGLGLIEFLMAFIAIWQLCCCRKEYGGGEMVTYQKQQVNVGQRTFVQAAAAPAITYGECQTGCAPRVPAPRINSCQPCGGGGGNGVYYRPATTTGFSPRPTTYNYFANSRQNAYNQYR